MRLWHYKLIITGLLPDSQLIAQKRECDLIWKDIENGKQTNHILINYIWSYPNYVDRLASYYDILRVEFEARGFKFNSHYTKQFRKHPNPFQNHHNLRYLAQNFYNLAEKYDRGQKDFSIKRYETLEHFVIREGVNL